MRTTHSGYLAGYWPVALAAALIVVAALHAYRGDAASHAPLAADKVTAELARAVSYGLIDAETARTVPAVHQAVMPATAPEASST